MLQQTQVATVIDYWNRFLKRFPDVQTLAAAPESDVLKLWEGLGYYRRARQLHAAAKQIVDVHAGKFPTTFDEVLALPGVGRYTAGAVLSISLDQSLPILEGNTVRLLARLLGMTDDPKATSSQKTLWEFSESLLPRTRCGDFNQALMELGALICRPREPDCDACPVRQFCVASVTGQQHVIPTAGKKMVYESIYETVVLIAKPSPMKPDAKLLIRLCQPGERWAGLWDFPRFQIDSKELNLDPKARDTDLASRVQSLTGFTGELVDSDIQFRHAVTRYRISLTCRALLNPHGRMRRTRNESFRWVTIADLTDVPMSVTGRKIADRLPLKQLQRPLID